MRAIALIRGAGLALAACALCACETQFDPCFGSAQKISDFRVLAVRADPPEVVFDPADTELPPVTVSMLIVDPRTNQPVDIAVSLCPQLEDKRCGPGALQMATVTSSGPVVSFKVKPTPELLRAAVLADPLHGYGGIRVQVDMVLTGSFQRASRATKTLLYTPRTPGYVPNHSFEIVGLNLTSGGRPMGFVGQNETLNVSVADQVGILPALAPTSGIGDAAEEYDVVDLSGRPAHLKEHLSYSLYSTVHAHFLTDTAEQPPLDVAPSLDGVFKFQATLTANGTLYIVARDGRGGVAWYLAPWNAVDTREGRVASLELSCE